jgi:hypothetical protein
MGSQAKQIAYEPTILGRWYRIRGFGLGPFGEKWWVAALNKAKITPMGMDEILVTAYGGEFIEVLDIEDGTALYRQYLTNSDGELVTVHFAPQYETIWSMPAGRLRGTIKRMKMERERAVVQQRQTAEIIAFPASRIVRRIEHGRGVVVAKQ